MKQKKRKTRNYAQRDYTDTLNRPLLKRVTKKFIKKEAKYLNEFIRAEQEVKRFERQCTHMKISQVTKCAIAHFDTILRV